MAIELIKVTNIGLRIGNNFSIPCIKAVINVTGTDAPSREDIIRIYDQIYAVSTGKTGVCGFTHHGGDGFYPGISNRPGVYVYDSDTDDDLHFEYNIAYNYNIQTDQARTTVSCRLYHNSTNQLIGGSHCYTGYGDYESAVMVIFVDADNNVYYTTNQSADTGLYELCEVEPGLTTDKYKTPIVSVMGGNTLRYSNALTIPTTLVPDLNIGDLIINEVDPDNTDPYGPGGESNPGGGHGTFSDNGDIVGEPSLPTLSAVDTGFIQLFKPSIADLKALASVLWSNDFFTDFIKGFANPLDVILGLGIVPVDFPVESSPRHVAAGNIDTNVSMYPATTQYVKVDCGSLDIKEFWGAYIDYDPFTTMSIYLPYIGIKPLQVDAFMDKTMQVIYHIDILTGACVAYVLSNGTQMASWAGQCMSQIPVSSQQYPNIVNGVLGAASGLGVAAAAAAMTLNPLAVFGVIAGGFAASSSMVNATKRHSEMSGSLTSTAGLMGVQKPYLIVERPRQAVPGYQSSYEGYPSFITRKLGDLSGLTIVKSIRLNGIPATDEELNEIDKLLKTGVII